MRASLDEPEDFNKPPALALGDTQEYIELREEEARSLSAKPDAKDTNAEVQ